MDTVDFGFVIKAQETRNQTMGMMQLDTFVALQETSQTVEQRLSLTQSPLYFCAFVSCWAYEE